MTKLQMIRMLTLSMLWAVFGVLSGQAASAAITVKGQVTDVVGEPMIGVSVVIKGTSVGTATNLDGNYELSVADPKAILTFSYLSYLTQNVTVGSQTVINVTLKEDNNVLDELVVVGYSTQKRVNLTGAVGTIDVSKQLESRPITDVGRGLQGATPGLTITTSSGRLGSTPNIRIRGASGTLLNEDYGASKPLILVDNVEISDLNMVNPDDIESISVLKDAASSSIYGTRAAFGVILITTKSGNKEGKFSATYSGNFAWTSPTVVPKMAKSYESAAMALEAYQRRIPAAKEFPGTLKWDAATIERMKEWDRVYGGVNLGPEMVLGRDFELIGGKPYFYRSFDAADEYMQDGFTQQHNLSVDNSSGKTNYHLGIGYMGDQGILKINPDNYDRYSASFNTDTEINKWLKVRSKLMFSRTVLDKPFSFSSYENPDANPTATNGFDVLYYLYRWPVTYPYGTYEGKPFRGAVAEAQQANRSTDTKDYTRITLGGTITFTKDISLDADYTFVMDNRLLIQRGGETTSWNIIDGGFVYEVAPDYGGGFISKSQANRYDQYNYKTDHHTGNIILRYNKEFNKIHKLNAFGGFNVEYEYANKLEGERRTLLDFNKPSLSLAVGDQTNPDGTTIKGDFLTGYQRDWASAGFFARVNYSLKDRYLLELNGRYDGSSRFPLDQQWGFFPSMSAGYIISEEEFMESTKDWLSLAKIRYSYGSIGNQDIGRNMFLPIMNRAASGWIVGSANEYTFGVPRAIANGFTWESIVTNNLGLDTRFLNNRLGLSADIYQRINDGMVVTGVGMPATFGASAPYMNVGELTTNGWEIGADFNHTFSNGLKLRLNANLSDALTKITKNPNPSLLDGRNYEGKILGEIWGFETDRFFTADDFDENGALKPEIPSQARYEVGDAFTHYLPGDIKYKDLDESGVIDRGENTADNHGDLKRIGNSTPRYEYSGRIGLEWKGFDLDIFIQGVGSRQIWGSGNTIIPGYMGVDGVYYANQTDYWTPENPNAFYPRLSYMSQPSRYGEGWQNFMPQTKYLLNMAYCRLKNVTFGYSLPKELLQKAQLSKTRIYVSFENLFELDKLGDIPIDPETNNSLGDGGAQGFGRVYPYVRTISCGIQVTL
ncbi:SusC/RagA family TonB-linked outer membrane protein [Bacteroidia bacterium]|nr:SusC/RagA family TonB-linked outer membrane protein [Bacteroidia bacterium]